MAGVPASSHGGGLPAQWSASATGAIAVASSSGSGDFDDLFNFGLASPSASILDGNTAGGGHWHFREDGVNLLFDQDAGSDRPGSILRIREYDVIFYGQSGSTALVTVDRDNNALGFYNHAAATQQSVTSGTVTPEQLALALQATGILGGT